MLQHVKNCSRRRLTSKQKIEALLKSRDEGDILRSLEDAEQRLADARANWTADKSSNNDTSPDPDDERREFDGHNADDRQDPKDGGRWLQIEELSIHSQGKVTKPEATKPL